MKLIAVVLVLFALAAEVCFLLTGAGHPHATPNAIAQGLGPHLAGQPPLAVGGALAFVFGVLLLGRRAEVGEDYALPEVILVLAVGAAAALTAALFVGVARVWSHPTLAVLGAAALLEVLVALGLGIRLALAKERRKILFVPGLLGAVGVAGLLVLVLVKGTA